MVKRNIYINICRMEKILGVDVAGPNESVKWAREQFDASMEQLRAVTSNEALADKLGEFKNTSSLKEIILVQLALVKLGYNPGTVDGVYRNGASKTSKTIAAVEKFQEDHNLKKDGQVGPQTLAAIAAALRNGGVAAVSPAESTESSGPLDLAKHLGADIVRGLATQGINILETNKLSIDKNRIVMKSKPDSEPEPKVMWEREFACADAKSVTVEGDLGKPGSDIYIDIERRDGRRERLGIFSAMTTPQAAPKPTGATAPVEAKPPVATPTPPPKPVTETGSNKPIAAPRSRWDSLNEENRVLMEKAAKTGFGRLDSDDMDKIAAYDALPSPKALVITESGSVAYATGRNSNEAQHAALKKVNRQAYVISVDGDMLPSVRADFVRAQDSVKEERARKVAEKAAKKTSDTGNHDGARHSSATKAPASQVVEGNERWQAIDLEKSFGRDTVKKLARLNIEVKGDTMTIK